MKDLSNLLKSSLPFIIMMVVISPFVLINSLFFPYITGKAFYFRIIVEIATALFLILAFIDKGYRPKWSPLTIITTVFTGILCLSTIFAVDASKAFWSNYERMEGLILFLHLWAFFIVAGTIMKKREGWWNWFFNASLVMSVIVGVGAYISFYSDPNNTGYRIFGTLGNSSYLGVYSMAHFFIALFYIVKKIGFRSIQALREKGSFVSIGFYSLIAVFNIIVLFSTGTRGSFVGLVGGILIAALLITIFEKRHVAFRNTGIVLLATSITFVAVLGLFKDRPFIKDSDMLRRFSELVTLDVKGVLENQGNARKMLWGMAWEGAKERPVLGWGLDNFHYVFAEKYNPAMYAQEQWFDRSHNVFMDWLTSAGILGLLSYLSLFGAAIYMIWRIPVDKMSYALKAIVIGGFAAYLGHNLFVFDNLSSYILFFAILAWIHDEYRTAIENDEIKVNKFFRVKTVHAESQKQKATDKELKSIEPGLTYGFAVLVLFVFAYVCYSVNIKPMSANSLLLDSFRPAYRESGSDKVITISPEEKFKKIEEVVNRDVMSNSEATEQLAERAGEVFNSPTATSEAKMAAYQTVVKQYAIQFERTPLDPRPHYFLAIFFNRAGSSENALAEVNKALELSPNKQSFLGFKTMMLVQLKRYDEAAKTAEYSYSVEKRNTDSQILYINALILNNQAEKAEELFGSGTNTLSYLKNPNILTAYMDANQSARLITVLNREIAKQPKNIDLHTALISVYVRLNNKSAAIRALNALRVQLPELSGQIDATIDEINAK